MSKFRYRNPFRFVSSIFISQLDHLVQEFACLLAIDFRVHYPRNLIFRFLVNYDWSRDQLYSLREKVGCSGFKHRHMEGWMNRVHGLQKIKSEQWCTRLVKIKEGGLDLFYFSFYFYFLFDLFLFSIFRKTRVRVDQSCHHISHLMAKSQDRS